MMSLSMSTSATCRRLLLGCERPANDRRRNLTKTLDYLEVFSRFKDEENIKAVERLLNSHTELEMFERSQLGSPSLFLFLHYLL